MTAILEARDVHFSYSDGFEALKGLSFAIDEGRKIALVGPNGAGKSTIMLMFNGILKPTSGEIRFRGAPLRYDSKSLREVRRKIGIVFQNPDDQLFAPTVYQDIAFGPNNLDFPREKVERYVNYALAYVGLSGYEKRPPHHLSGGEKKRVAIAGVLAMEPDVIILDEPTSNLDPASSEEVMEMLDELSYGGKTMIISTHDEELAYRWADEIILMEGGRILHRGLPISAFSNIELVKQARIKLPRVMEIYYELVNRGILNGTRPPRNVLELTNMIEEVVKGKVSRPSLGRIFIWNVDRSTPAGLKIFLEKKDVDFIGAMGTLAKTMAGKEKIDLDFTYGVIDKCILKALT
ncbi:MAG: ATP-binding cassette domain-containing protein, partial [Methanotrichaceae archaeon]|nr:ATP-binding cassette domain-containing protein [Methanotrichaceae archaeon]